jgi:predicted nucleic-acid-binding protein
MIALDTEILLRLVVNDDPKLGRQAVQLIDSGAAFFVPLTVSLELEWMLRGVYKLEASTVVNIFEALLSIRNVSFQNDADLAAALKLLAQGMAFTDALHLLSSAKCDHMITFDMKFAQAAKRSTNPQEVKLLMS